MPSVKFVDKHRIRGPVEKKYDFPKTPNQRVLESACITKTEKLALTELYRNLNPFALSATVNCEVKQFLAQTRQIQLNLDIILLLNFSNYFEATGN